MIKVKISAQFTEWHQILDQTPNSAGIWDNCQFFINQDIEECDFWVIYDDLIKPEKTRCLPENTIFITAEPPSVKKYNKKFLKQFGTIITCHNFKHPNVVQFQQGLPWNIGLICKSYENIKYDELKEVKEFQKDNLISLIVSRKNFTEGHRKRLEFVEKLSEHFGSGIDIFGSGRTPVKNKWDGIAGYKYHIAIENSQFPHYWTEKLADVYLAGAYPFYYGCPKLSDYFPEGSYTYIDINNPDEAIKIIEETIQNNQYEKSVEKIIEARNLILDKYNLFALLADFCNAKEVVQKKTVVSLKPQLMFSRSIIYKNLMSKIKNLLKR